MYINNGKKVSIIKKDSSVNTPFQRTHDVRLSDHKLKVKTEKHPILEPVKLLER